MKPAALLELPNPFATEHGSIRLLEAGAGDRSTLLQRVLSGEYDRPFVIDDGTQRSLYFSLALVQSVMRVAAPDTLELAYTRKMMSFLLFLPRPHHILMFGLGGGSLLKFCRRHLPLTRLTAVEVHPDVIAFRDLFHIPPDDARLEIVLADAADYIAACRDRPEVILMDAFDRHGCSLSTACRAFYDRLRAMLAGNGVLVANLAGSTEEREMHLAMIGHAFDDNYLVLPVREGGNQIIVAFRDRQFEPRWKWIESQAPVLGKRYGLDFPFFVKKLDRRYMRSGALRQRSR